MKKYLTQYIIYLLFVGTKLLISFSSRKITLDYYMKLQVPFFAQHGFLSNTDTHNLSMYEKTRVTILSRQTKTRHSV